jgi:hypothetical protein
MAMRFRAPPPAVEPSYVDQDGLSIYHVVTGSGMVEVRWHSKLSREELKELLVPFLRPLNAAALHELRARGALWI